MSLDLPDGTAPGASPQGPIHPSPGGEPTRRAVLGGALAGAASLALAVAAGASIRQPALARESGRFTSVHWPGRQIGWTLARPETPRGLVIALHGMGGRAADWFGSPSLERALRGTGLAVAAVDGAATYWHPRTRGPYAGSDTARMVIDDYLTLLAGRGLPTARVGLLGTSMGGYGALYVASLLGPDRVFGVATLAAALRTSGVGTYPERFDDPADYAAHDVFARAGELARIPLFLACGDKDRFRAGNEAFANRVPHAETMFDEGDHVAPWFEAHLPPAIRFLADHAAPAPALHG